MRFDELYEGQVFSSSFTISKQDFDNYIAAARTANVLLHDSSTAMQEGLAAERKLVPGRLLIARAEGEMTRTSELAGNTMLLYGTDGDSNWGNRQTRFVSQAYVGDELIASYLIAGKNVASGNNAGRYGILAVDFEIKKVFDDSAPVAVSRQNLYRVKR